MTPLSLYQYAEEQNIAVTWFTFDRAASLSVCLPDGSCCIAIDPWKMGTVAEETVALAHELGHCETGSFYGPGSPFEVRQQQENRADKWAIRRLIPAEELERAVAEGHRELWDLAEHFGVTEEFMRKAVRLHCSGNLYVS